MVRPIDDKQEENWIKITIDMNCFIAYTLSRFEEERAKPRRRPMEPKITQKEVMVNRKWRKAIECWRVKYGKKETPVADREYQLFKGSPVGTIDEIVTFVQGRGYEVDGLLLADPISNCTLFKFIGGGVWDLNIKGK